MHNLGLRQRESGENGIETFPAEAGSAVSLAKPATPGAGDLQPELRQPLATARQPEVATDVFLTCGSLFLVRSFPVHSMFA